jgi:phosphoribosylformylglycinamidine cyclo-ligase
MIDYKSAGVDIDVGNEVVKRIKKGVQATYNKNVLSELGGFAGLYDLRPLFTEYVHPVLVQSIDGLGTKPVIASQMGKYEGLGFDLLSSTCNDIIVCGAKPLTLLDYIGGSKIKLNEVVAIVDSIAKAAKAVNVALLGGETAEMPGVYAGNEYDVVGIVTGVVDKDKIITGKNIQAGDAVLAFGSSGLHTNGYSLARKLCFEVAGWKVNEVISDFKGSVGDTLLAPHINYTLPVLALLKQNLPIIGMAHITGGGVLENIPRILPKGCAVEINLGSWPIHPIFKALVNLGKLTREEAYRTFNMGIGYVLIVRPDAAADIQQIVRTGFRELSLYEIGKVVPGETKVTLK